jgi:hypothetical protein
VSIGTGQKSNDYKMHEAQQRASQERNEVFGIPNFLDFSFALCVSFCGLLLAHFGSEAVAQSV